MCSLFVLSACATAQSEQSPPPGVDSGSSVGGRVDAATEVPDAGDGPLVPSDAMVVTPVPDASPNCTDQTVNLLANSGFDMGPGGGWMESSGANPPYALVVTGPEMPEGVAPQAGTHAIWLGGYLAESSIAIDSITQSVAIPGDATDLEVTGHVWIASAESFGIFDTLDIELVDSGGAVLESLIALSNSDEDTTWGPVSGSASGDYAGQTVGLRIRSEVDNLLNTNFFVDSMQLTVTTCQ